MGFPSYLLRYHGKTTRITKKIMLFRVFVNVSDRPGTFVFLTWVSIGYPTQSGNCSSDKK